MRLLVIACVALLSAPISASAAPCQRDAPTTAGEIRDDRIVEASGMDASTQTPGVIWLHNDSGDGPYLFAASTDGTPLGRWLLTGEAAIDWEDISVGACPTGQCIYVGDIGNNALDRTDLAILRVSEPAIDVAAAMAMPVEGELTAERFSFSYADDAQHDAESLFVGPTGEVFVVTKPLMGEASLYGLPTLSLGPALQATRLAGYTFGTVPILDQSPTGADLSADGTRLVVRSYSALHEFEVVDLDLVAALQGTAVATPVVDEPQGEAVSYGPAGTDIWTTYEGRGSAIHTYACRETPMDPTLDTPASDTPASDTPALETPMEGSDIPITPDVAADREPPEDGSPGGCCQIVRSPSSGAEDAGWTLSLLCCVLVGLRRCV